MTTVMICDDDPIVREALGGRIDREPGLEVVAAVGTAKEALAMVGRTPVDVVLMDLALPGTDGIAATRQLRELQPAPAVLALTTFGTDEHVRASIGAGAAGFLLKTTGASVLVAAIRAVAAGAGTLITPELASPMAVDGRGRPRHEEPGARAAMESPNLTDREAQVLSLLCAAESNAGIAGALSLLESTVESHASSLMTKLDCTSRLQIALRAFGHGLAAPPGREASQEGAE